MDEKEKLKIAASQIVRARQHIISTQPFFSRLLMHLPIGFADCETACTDMRKIYFGIEFALRLSDEEITFVLLHELMHCVLKHCIRGRDKIHFVYNVACDIVVNSIILDSMGKADITVDGVNAMHLAPDGKEGREYSTEEIYNMLLKADLDELMEAYSGFVFDNHGVWGDIGADNIFEQIWDGNIIAASKAGEGIPGGLERTVRTLDRSPKIDWRQVLHDFIQQDKSDYTFMHPDRRFQGDVLLPSFAEKMDGASVKNLWFLIDTSGSISDDALAEAYTEITDAIRQMESLSGFVSFFDCDVTEPKAFDSAEELSKIKPIGGGGTSFSIIFRKMTEFFSEKPELIIILTDGGATFPDEKKAQDVPVMWIIIDSEVDAPWGECVHIYTD